MKVSVNSDISRIRNLPNAVAKQFRFAAPKALNDTAFKAREDLGKHAKLVFENPVVRTVNAGRVEKAKRGQLSARVYLREDMNAGIQPGKYLRAEIEGGQRRDKRLERALRQTTFITKKMGSKPVLPNEYIAVPHPSATNMRGNLTSARSKKIIADMKMNGRGQQYFLVHPDSHRPSGITPGIYQRRGKSLKLTIIFVERNSVRYNKTYKFYKVAGATYDRWMKIYMRKYFESALKTMRV